MEMKWAWIEYDELEPGQGIVDEDGHAVPINGVPAYSDALAEEPGTVPWWSHHAEVNGYCFSATGGTYCAATNLGLTALMTELSAPGVPTVPRDIETIVLCDYAFTMPKFPASYKAGVAMITQGMGLEKVVPRSSTLLHEAFHALFGTGPTGFLEGDEIYDIGKCIEAAGKKSSAKTVAKRNPENYVFYVAKMYYLFGEHVPDGSPSSIDQRWDFDLSSLLCGITFLTVRAHDSRSVRLLAEASSRSGVAPLDFSPQPNLLTF
ncbi:hypothetical protein B0T24DRAFT_593691 [Lasiosphaeria ovina]|uniref:Uncharacterized protein n=1 Tax=Lasiosphaeria ovina TaxID=92902 RepID=A0AAE0KB54_9PEZI|nr:hypothetical protein B0T24DRAFT_593691 [Lasiosphaeria ovina]